MSAVDDARAEALFCTPLQRSASPSGMQVRAAVTEQQALFTRRACAAVVAQEFGEHPELAVARMRWAITAVRHAFDTAHV
uniref:hypothetical protein n=1 Tax=Paractinoplanes polyasparticus TaxID=2856853 RepID=UPI001C85D9C1|nr:hypothetical protein [Actinoplanes polyasparticus]